MEIKDKIGCRGEHNYIPVAWDKSLFCNYVVKLACSKCGEIINTNITTEEREKHFEGP